MLSMRKCNKIKSQEQNNMTKDFIKAEKILAFNNPILCSNTVNAKSLNLQFSS